MDIVETRRANLRAWLSKNKVPPKEKSLFSQLTGTGSFGERVSRRIEKQYGMGENYLDTPIETGLEPTSPPKVTTVEGVLKKFGLPKQGNLASVHDLVGYEGQLIGLFRALTKDEREEILMLVQKMVAARSNGVSSGSDPFANVGPPGPISKSSKGTKTHLIGSSTPEPESNHKRRIGDRTS